MYYDYFKPTLVRGNLMSGIDKMEHLGDGVYASFDGYQIALRVNDHRNPPVVFIEPLVLAALVAYYEARLAEGKARLAEGPERTFET